MEDDWFDGMDFTVDDIDFDEEGYDWANDSFDTSEWSGDGESGSNWLSNLFGNSGNGNGSSSGNNNYGNWINLLAAGYSNYQNDRNQDQRDSRGREHDIALTILRDQLANAEYDRRQGQLRDAYTQYNDYGKEPRGSQFSLLSSFGYPNTNRQQGATYNGY